MPIDLKELHFAGNNISLLTYQPKYFYGQTDNNSLILAFKRNEDAAVQWVTEAIIQLLAEHEMAFQDQLKCRYLVSIPSSTALRDNTPCERVCAALAERFNWLTHLPHALERVQTVQKSSQARSYAERPKYSLHMETIIYKGQSLDIPDKTIVMLDDVITCGETSKACRSILERVTNCHRVIGLFVGRTPKYS